MVCGKATCREDGEKADLSWKCRRHVGDMSATRDIVGRFWRHGLSLPTRCRHVAQGAVSRVRSTMSARQKYETTNTTHTTMTTVVRLGVVYNSEMDAVVFLAPRLHHQ